MIKSILLKNVATYPESGERIKDLKKVNFFFGGNGTGKTMISRVIADAGTYAECDIEWDDPNEEKSNPPIVKVYNQDFVDANFQSETKGVFTLGEDARDRAEEIDKFRKKKISASTKKSNLLAQLDGKKELRQRTIERDGETFWKSKENFSDSLKKTLTGVLGAKDKFREQLVHEFVNNQTQVSLEDLEEMAKPVSLEDLEERAKIVFAQSPIRLNPLPSLGVEGLIKLCKDSILSTPVKGDAESAVAKLIRKLDNEDWVHKGMTYLERESHRCPFCQEDLSKERAAALNEFFSGEYVAGLRKITDYEQSFRDEAERTISSLKDIIVSTPSQFQTELLNSLLVDLEKLLSQNEGVIKQKLSEPSGTFFLEPLEGKISEIQSEVKLLQDKITDNNKLVDNISEEQESLKRQTWRYLFERNKDDLETHISDLKNVDSAITNLESKIDNETAQININSAGIANLMKGQAGVESTAEKINIRLRSFGFFGFKLKSSKNNPGFYEIVRDNGDDAKESLSEGERRFITFLYFLEFINGSFTEDGISDRQIVVIDDPISSLDSDILFIVTCLIRDLVKSIEEDSSPVKQLFVLTHNIYFHNQLTYRYFNKKGSENHRFSFWLVRKRDEISSLKRFSKNPIKSSYRLLWQELKDDEQNPSTIANVMRRILEYYFQDHANKSYEDIFLSFKGEDSKICASLLNFANANSHVLKDDFEAPFSEEMITNYRNVFERIFKENGQEGHYQLMMHGKLKDDV